MKLKNKRIALFVEADYQDMEVHYPRYRLIEEGAEVVVIGTGSAEKYIGKNGYPVTVDMNADLVEPTTFDGLIIPGGWAPDKMRLSKPMVEFVQAMTEHSKVIGCICHGGWLLASAGVIKGVKLTSYIAIRDDLVNAGAVWVDQEVVVTDKLITSRKPDDLPAFMREVIRALAG